MKRFVHEKVYHKLWLTLHTAVVFAMENIKGIHFSGWVIET